MRILQVRCTIYEITKLCSSERSNNLNGKFLYGIWKWGPDWPDMIMWVPGLSPYHSDWLEMRNVIIQGVKVDRLHMCEMLRQNYEHSIYLDIFNMARALIGNSTEFERTSSSAAFICIFPSECWARIKGEVVFPFTEKLLVNLQYVLTHTVSWTAFWMFR